ncbi:hypothetical protein ACQ4PT_056154 [Festuca glaucescens]
MASSPLEFEDLSQTCRRDRYCQLCFRAFCSHCCSHHTRVPSHSVIPVDIDAGGKLVFSTTWEFGNSPESSRLRHDVISAIAAEDYATRLPRDLYCMICKKIFCSGACLHHGHEGPGPVLCIVERDGRYCVRCTGSEPWFPYIVSILGDRVGEHVDQHGKYQLLLPVIRRAPGSCVQSGGQIQLDFKQHCSETCATAHRREVALRRARRDARSAARELANLQVY